MATTLDQVRAVASDIFTVPADQLNTSSSPQDVGSWDSIQHLNLVLALEEKFNVQLSPEDIERMGTIGKICDVIESKLQTTSS